MLEGKEVEAKLGEFGTAFVDVNDKGVVEIGLSAKIDLLAELHKLAAKTATTLDDSFLNTLDKLLGK